MGGGSRGAMHRRGLAGFAAVVLACLALGAVGLGVEDDLSPFSLKIPGTSASDGETLAQSHFGDSSPFAILLRGPAPALDRQGSALVAELRREPEATVLSPWDRGSLSALRPGPRKALVLVDYHVPLGTAMREVAPGLEATVEEGVDPPVVATQSGFATVAQALQEESLNATERAELVAAPLLILVLLLVFRSLVAAAIPLVFGALTVLAAPGVVTTISILIATLAVPPLLALLGPRINALRVGPAPRPGGRSAVAAAAGRALRNPALAACLVAVPLVLLTLPVIGFSTGAPGIDELPSSNQARADAETIDRAVGPGWEAPFVLVAATERGPITTSQHLSQLARWQRRIGSEPGVRTVIGPAPVARRTAPLRTLGSRLSAQGGSAPSELEKLGPGLRRAADAVSQLRAGLDEGAAGSGLLAEGSERAAAGAGLIASELRRAAGRGEEATAAIGRLRDGSERLAKGQRQVSVGSLALALGLRSLVPRLRGGEQARSRRLARELEQAAAEDPSLQPLANQARVLARTVAANRNEVRRLRDVAQEVNGGINRLVPGGERLEAGVGKLADATNGLSSGLDRLGDGAERLSSGLVELQGGAGALQSGLSEGSRRAYPLQTKLADAGDRVSAVATPLALGAAQLQRQSPALFDSGYFVLSALDGAPARQRAEAGEAISLDGGGQAARMIVVSNFPFNSDGSRRVGEALEADAARLAAASGLETGVTGGAATLNTYGEATEARLPFVIGVFILFTLLALVVFLRAPLLALLTVCLNLASVAAAIGVMALVCKIPEGYPLGGHPYIDTVGAGAIFGVTFGLSIDYAVFLIARMRESYDVDGDHRAAIAFGLEKTAGVITGAAAIMAAVFVSFAAAPVATVSQMGVGLTVAILLDATVVRIVLLPAQMLLPGDRDW